MDPRIARTRSSLQQALLELARERPLEAITVSDIVDRAGVNRSSFYQHYSDKEVLLVDALDSATEEAAESLEPMAELPEGPPEALIVYLRHVDANADLYRVALGDSGSAPVIARVRDRIEAVVRDAVAASGLAQQPGLPVDILAAGIAGSALGVVRAWLVRDPRPSVETAAEWMWRVITGPKDGWGLRAR
ncbi:MAG: TetR family transcriptional regulator [Naasia sp.]|nr:TetR family transcriptional regulator [Naasia sp.]